MTAEVALLNKSAVALAADSATTVTYWDRNEPKTRYFKGANKVFNLSRRFPVGVMTFASANLNGVPWEVIIKAYRAHLKQNSHDHLSQYVADFFDFIKSCSALFPNDVQEKQFLAVCDRAAASIIIPAASHPDLRGADDATRNAKVIEAIDRREQELAQISLIPRAEQSDVDDAISKHLSAVTAQFRADNYYKTVVLDAEMERLARLSIIGAFKTDFRARNMTGLAFTGYGENEYFPRLEEYRCHGYMLGKAYYERRQEIVIDHTYSAEIVPLAQSNMIDTFIHGASYPTMNRIDTIFVKQLDELENTLRQNNLLPAGASLHQIKSDAEIAFRQEIVGYYYDEHRLPFNRVIANLPINELAELAETLVYIESLKERVTTPDESVSGPIDVAVISKHDGFIWIKRKHYFKPELNRRFFFNQQREV